MFGILFLLKQFPTILFISLLSTKYWNLSASLNVILSYLCFLFFFRLTLFLFKSVVSFIFFKLFLFSISISSSFSLFIFLLFLFSLFSDLSFSFKSSFFLCLFPIYRKLSPSSKIISSYLCFFFFFCLILFLLKSLSSKSFISPRFFLSLALDNFF